MAVAAGDGGGGGSDGDGDGETGDGGCGPRCGGRDARVGRAQSIAPGPGFMRM